MAFHCHQPAFNLGKEKERVYRKAYLPLLKKLERFPAIKSTFHFSGSLLEWLDREHPEFIRLTRKLIASGNIEILTGGYSDPIMTVIPPRDRIRQIRYNSEIIKQKLGTQTYGTWIPERVWAPELTAAFSASGVKYAIIDDHHVKQVAGADTELIYVPLKVQDGEHELVLFPGLTELRYSIPFRSPEEVRDIIRKRTSERDIGTPCFFFADDGEKFGAWPHTYRHVHTFGWLDRFLRMLTDSSEIETCTYSRILNSTGCERIGRIPESSYPEMMEWCSGSFSNFFRKYPESDRMRRRMLSVSEKLSRAETVMPEDAALEARKELFNAQANCPYWHGAFGGVYLPHLRAGIYKHLIKAEQITRTHTGDTAKRVVSVERESGEQGETLISNEYVGVFLSPHGGGAITELDHKRLCRNILGTMSRVREKYHRKLESNYAWRIKKARKAFIRGEKADLHDILGVSQRGLKRHLYYDDYSRYSFLTHIFTGEIPWEELGKGPRGYDIFLKGAYKGEIKTEGGGIKHILTCRRVMPNAGKTQGVPELEVVKSVEVNGNPSVFMRHTVHADSMPFPGVRNAVEFNFMIYDKNYSNGPSYHKRREFNIKDSYSGAEIDIRFTEDVRAKTYPVYSVNETEKGLGRTYQGTAFVFSDDLPLDRENNKSELQFSILIR
jgi:alpha-amylase